MQELSHALPRKEGYARGKVEAAKGRIYLEHSAGLGPKPNVIPPDDAIVSGALRKVEVGWHPVAGFGGKWFAEKTRLGKLITDKIGTHPDPTQHWAVLVDDYVHQLWMVCLHSITSETLLLTALQDEQFTVIYINEKINRDEWHTFEVGKTRFNDEALRQAGKFCSDLMLSRFSVIDMQSLRVGEMVIHNMRQRKPAYNLINNNCQTFAVAMLDAIQIGAHRDFATTFAIYQTATGLGSIKDLFVDPPEEQTISEQPQIQHQNTVQYAQQVMDANTTRVDHRC